MEQSTEAMPDIPAAEQAQPKAKGRRAAAVRSAPVLQGGAITEAAPVMPAVAAPKKRGARKTKSAKASIGEAAEAAVAGAAVKLELSDIKEEPAQSEARAAQEDSRGCRRGSGCRTGRRRGKAAALQACRVALHAMCPSAHALPCPGQRPVWWSHVSR